MSGAGFLIIIIAFGFLYFVLIRPQKRRQVDSQRMLQGLEIGDEVVTAGGILGTITALGDDEVSVEIAPNLVVRVARRAIGSVISRPEDPDGDEAVAGDGAAAENTADDAEDG
jgi:preprotein translocase subunit YajC